MKKCAALICVTIMAFSCLTGCLGFGEKDEAAVNVQSVAMICGFQESGMLDRFAGVVSSRGEESVEADREKKIKDVLVKEGDEVTAGQVLFTYDVELAALTLEKADLELQQMNTNLEAQKQAKAALEKEKEKAKAEEQLSYSLEIQQKDAEIREQNYNIALKEKEVARLQEALEVADCKAPIDGRVSNLNTDGTQYDNYGNPKPAVTIVEAGAYRVKGYVNENNAYSLMEGTDVLIRSRVDEKTWTGFISMIDWANPKTGNDNGYYYMGGDDEMSSTSKYPFYVELNDSEGLLLGQHVYIEPDLGQEAGEPENVVALSSFYIVTPDGGDAFVWAEENGKLKKRKVTLGEYDEMFDTYVIESGLTGDDYIAAPDETLKEGMSCIRYDNSSFEYEPEPGGVYYNGNGMEMTVAPMRVY